MGRARQIRRLGVPWEIRTDDVSAFNLLLEHLPPGSAPTRIKTTARRYSFRTLSPALSEPEPCYLLEADGRPMLCTSDAGEIAEALEDDLRWLVAERSLRRVFLRAGVVGWRDRAIVIAGGRRSGKSTLVRAFVACGATCFSEEYAVLRHAVASQRYPERVLRTLEAVLRRCNALEGVREMRRPSPPTSSTA